MRVAPVSQTLRSQLSSKARTLTEPKGAVLFHRGEPAFGIFVLRKGSINLRLESGEKTAIFERTVTPESIVGLPATLAGGRYSLTATTLEECELSFVDRQSLTELIKCYPSIGLELVRALGEEILQTREAMVSGPLTT